MDAGMGPGSNPEQTLERLISLYYTPILRLCHVILQDRSSAEDAAQDTFLKAYRGLGNFRGQCSEKTWLTSIAVNTCRDMRKSAWFRHTEKRITPEELPIPAPSQEDSLALMQAIRSLPEKYRDVILLYYYQDMTMQETAFALKTASSTIAKRLARAREMLRKALEVTQHDG